MILLCFCSGIFDVRCKNYLIFFFVIVLLLEIAPRTACSLESAFFRGCHSCTQAPAFHPARSTCVLLLIGVSFEWKLILPENLVLSYPLSDSSFPLPRCVPALAPGADPGGMSPDSGTLLASGSLTPQLPQCMLLGTWFSLELLAVPAQKRWAHIARPFLQVN